jgi:hypothetical protein
MNTDMLLQLVFEGTEKQSVMCLHHKVQIKRRAKKEIQMEENKTDNTYDRRNEKRKRKMT